jgi:FKBP-type peptidyl-prolyl cis-trans isomerase 2
MNKNIKIISLYYLTISFMKKMLSFLFLGIAVSACSLPFKSQESANPQDGDTVAVHYVGTYDDGTEFDSSRKENRTPLEFTIGKGGMIPGFELAVRSMEIGEIKKVHIVPEDAYGEEYMEKTIPLDQFKEVITQKVPASVLTGNLEQKIPKDQAQQLFSSLEAGIEKKIGEATLKILSVTDADVLVSIDEPKATFYGKKLTAGLKAIAQDGSEITIKDISGNDVNIDIKQKQEIVSKTDKDITVRVKNPHPLAGKALNFEIELMSIKKPTAEITE